MIDKEITSETLAKLLRAADVWVVRPVARVCSRHLSNHNASIIDDSTYENVRLRSSVQHRLSLGIGYA